MKSSTLPRRTGEPQIIAVAPAESHASSSSSSSGLVSAPGVEPAPGVQRPVWAAPELAYHRLAHVTPSSGRWWRPLAMIVAFIASTLVVALVSGLLVWGVLVVFPEIPSPSKALEDPRNPADVAYSFGSIAMSLPVVWLTMRLASGRRGTIASIVGRLRWTLLWRALAVVLPVYGVLNAVMFFADRPSDFSVPPLDGRMAAVVIVAVLVVPLQAAAEEYVFRGLIPQMIGTWLRSPLWGALVSVPLFVLGHGYDVWGLVDVGVFAVCASFLAWKSGGLELPIVLHVANNLTLTLLAPFSPSSMHQGAVAPSTLLLSVPMTLAVTAALSWYVSREYGLRRFEPVRRAATVRAI